jgi:hypothetical protein
VTSGPPPSPVADPVASHAVQIHGDGDQDLVAVMRNRDASGVGAREASVVVWWNVDGFTPTNTQIMNGDYADAALVDLDRDNVRELVVLERSARLVVSRLDAGAFREFTPLAPATDGVALQAADVNGDGLTDLVVVTGIERTAPRELSVYTQSEIRIPAGDE